MSLFDGSQVDVWHPVDSKFIRECRDVELHVDSSVDYGLVVSAAISLEMEDGEIKHEIWIFQVDDSTDIRLKPLLTSPLRERTFYFSVRDDALVMASPLGSIINLEVINIGEAQPIARFCVTVGWQVCLCGIQVIKKDMLALLLPDQFLFIHLPSASAGSEAAELTPLRAYISYSIPLYSSPFFGPCYELEQSSGRTYVDFMAFGTRGGTLCVPHDRTQPLLEFRWDTLVECDANSHFTSKCGPQRVISLESFYISPEEEGKVELERVRLHLTARPVVAHDAAARRLGGEERNDFDMIIKSEVDLTRTSGEFDEWVGVAVIGGYYDLRSDVIDALVVVTI